MFNKTIVQVNCTKDSELRSTQQGDSSRSVLNFSAANNRKIGDKEYTTYYECSIWGKRAEGLAEYIKKGTALILTGTVSADAYTNKDGQAVGVLRLNVQELDFCGGRKAQSEDGADAGSGESFMNIPDGIDEALPFK